MTLKKEYKFLLILIIIFAFNVYVFWLKQGSIIIDVGREFYIPWQMLKGQILYRDIYNIYGPLAYQINALSFLIFGQKISSIVALGIINSFLITLTYYFISREFLSKKISLLLSLVLMQGGIFITGLFNYNMPYAYAMPYAFSSFLFFIMFFIRFLRTDEEKFLYTSAFFAGVSLSFKYDYFFIPFVIFFSLWFFKSLTLRRFLFSSVSFMVVPCISFGFLFFQGMNVNDLISAILLDIKLSNTSTIKYLYKTTSGTYFDITVFKSVLDHFLGLIVYLSGVFCSLLGIHNIGAKKLKPILNSIILLLSVIYFFFFVRITSLGLMPIFVVVLACAFYKKLLKDKSLLFISVCAVLASLKVFFAMPVNLYGAYVFPLLILVISILILTIESNNFFLKNLKNTYKIFLCSLLVTFIVTNFTLVKSLGTEWKTTKGSLYNKQFVVDVYYDLQNYISKNTSKNDKIIIWPETPLINFVTDRDSDNIYFNMLPLQLELFGEQKVIEDIAERKPEIIIFNNRDSSDYGFKYICKDYAINLCKYVNQYYSFVKIVGDEKYYMKIYKRNDLI